MLPKAVQRAINKHRKEQSKQQSQSDSLLIQADSEYHYKQLVREIRRDRYVLMGVTIAVGILQAIFLTYLCF